MSNFAVLLAAISMVLVLTVLGIGIISMIKGGKFNKKYGNKLMRARIILQGIALGLIALAFFASQGA